MVNQREFLEELLGGSGNIQVDISKSASWGGELAKTAALVSTLLAQVTRLRFPTGCSRGDIVRFVAEMRLRAADVDGNLEPRLCELLLRAQFGDADAIDQFSSADIERSTRLGLHLTLIRALAAELDLDDTSQAELIETAERNSRPEG